MNKAQKRNKLKIAAAALALSAFCAAPQIADASVPIGTAVSDCQTTMQNYDSDYSMFQKAAGDPGINAFTKIQDPLAWKGSAGGGCLDILPTGISLTMTFPTMEEIIEAIMKAVAQAMCQEIRSKIGGNVNQLVQGVSSMGQRGNIGGVAGTNWGVQPRVTNGWARTGVATPAPAQAPAQSPVQPRLAPVTVTPAAQAPAWNPAGSAQNARAPGARADDEGFFGSVSRKVGCFFGGNCNQ